LVGEFYIGEGKNTSGNEVVKGGGEVIQLFTFRLAKKLLADRRFWTHVVVAPSVSSSVLPE
jgi:hypothetical protein